MKLKSKPKSEPITPQRKQSYNELGKWLKLHGITHKRLYPWGFSIDTRSVPKELINEFIEISTF
jgi:hypothetical protein